jgi:hypothetical protein
MAVGLRRRDLLITAALLAAARPGRSIAAAAIDPVRFQAISAKLCGVALDDLEFAKAIETELLGDTVPADLLALLDLVAATPSASLDAAISGHGLDALANRIVAVWYSGMTYNGMTGLPGAVRVLSFTSAAAWTATGYAKPPTYCGLQFGDWAEPP